METNINQPTSLSGEINELLLKYPVILQFSKFVAIGFLGAALDFLILNYLSKTFNITVGLRLGKVNVPGVVFAIIQNYLWNRYWAFGNMETRISLFKNFSRLVLAGVLGVGTLALVLFGAKIQAPSSYYLILLMLFVIFEVLLWHYLSLRNPQGIASIPVQFLSFVIVSGIGLLINTTLISLVSSRAILSANVDLNKNLAKVAANAISLFWNFIGYKLIVFKK